MTSGEIHALLTERLGDAVSLVDSVEYAHGTAKRAVSALTVELPRERLHDAVAALCDATSPHVTVISGDDRDASLILNYHFNVGWGEHGREVVLTLRVTLPKDDLSIPTLTDLIPGALTTEREGHEFYGIEFVGIPDDRNLFLPEGTTIHPWRRDEAATKLVEPTVKRLVKWETRDGQ